MVCMPFGKGLMKKENVFIRILSLVIILRWVICLRPVAVLAQRRKRRVIEYSADRYG